MRGRPIRGASRAAVLLLLAGALCGAAVDEPARRLFESANAEYAAGRYEEAARRYRQLLSQGLDAAAVRYNLGNALYRMGRLGPAILEHERAAALDPSDPDIQANLEFLRSQTADVPAAAGARTASAVLERLLAVTTPDQDAAAFAAFYLLAASLAAVLIAASRPRLRRAAAWTLALTALPLLASGATLAAKLYREGSLVQGIVLEARLDVRSGPGDDNAVLFTVHEGLKVRVRQQQGSWCHVSLETGLNGWVSSSSVGIL